MRADQLPLVRKRKKKIATRQRVGRRKMSEKKMGESSTLNWFIVSPIMLEFGWERSRCVVRQRIIVCDVQPLISIVRIRMA